MGWGNICKRRMKVCAVALLIYLDYKALQQREKWANKTKTDALWENAHKRNAKRVLSLIVELEGLWVKLGQYLSTRADVLPEAYICLLKQLQDSLPPRPLEEVCQTIQKELGKSMNELFLDFVDVPLATASIKMSAYKMAHDIENQLDNLSDLSSEGCIYRVPERLWQVNEKAYTPQVVSIGPLHHGNEALQAMEEHKLRYLRHFLRKSRVRLSDCMQKIQDQEERLRGFYAEPIVFDKDEFVRIVSVDAAFVIDFLLRFHFSNYREDEYDYVFSKPTIVWDVCRDLKLLENQLPFFILQELFTLLPSSHQLPSLLEISYHFFQGKKEKFDKICSSGVEVQHFVDLIRILYLPLEPEKKPITTDRHRHIMRATPSVTELLQAGVKFEVGKDSSLFDIKFTWGILEIPKLTVDDSTDLVFRNILASEQCHHREEHYLAHYVFLMNHLAKTPKDVQLLVEKGIIENWLGDTQKISTLLHDLGTGMIVYDGYYAPLCENLIKYRTSPWHKFKENFHEFLQTYAITPWFIISSVPAVILLILTLIQTMCSIKSIA